MHLTEADAKFILSELALAHRTSPTKQFDRIQRSEFDLNRKELLVVFQVNEAWLRRNARTADERRAASVAAARTLAYNAVRNAGYNLDQFSIDAAHMTTPAIGHRVTVSVIRQAV